MAIKAPCPGVGKRLCSELSLLPAAALGENVSKSAWSSWPQALQHRRIKYTHCLEAELPDGTPGPQKDTETLPSRPYAPRSPPQSHL